MRLIVDYAFGMRSETMKTAAEIVKGISHQREGKRSKEKEAEGRRKGGPRRKAEERGEQASRRSPFIARLANLEEGRCQ
ncbi:hypothetical protein PUN28_010282 [Cardiocondyla obscurior]|uniref:Uncharacterized protein n=1 Tax=Cardiocondyla obscurior TaxID=286306 RepID=A0AAW2FQ18_9HYME